MLEIRLFGSMQVVLNGVEIRMSPAARMLLAYLILHRNELGTAVQTREQIIDRFWGHLEEKQARRCLSTTLWRLRRELETAVADQVSFVFSTPSGDLGFNFDSNSWIDVAVFIDKIQRVMQRPLPAMGWDEANLIEEARTLYRQDLLAGAAEDWVYHEQERLNLLYANSLSRLMYFYEQENQYEKGLDCGEEVLAMDPLREHVHRYMMRVYMSAGRRAKSVRQYHICREILAQELGIQPMPETQVLFAEIVSNQPVPKSFSPVPVAMPISPSNGSNDLAQLAQSVDAMMSHLEQVQQQLSQVQQAIAALSGKS